MKLPLFLFVSLALVCSNVSAKDFEFSKPKLLTVEGNPIQTQSPGWACPGVGDVDGDGQDELLVGQFAQGAIWIFEPDKGTNYQSSRMLEADGKPAVIDGVW